MGDVTDAYGDRDVPEEDSGDDMDAICDLAQNITSYLDDYQTPGDGRVLYCHSGSGHSYNLVDSDVDACSAHLDHDWDVFPSTGCDT
jgi:hypothetical protein